MSPKVKFLKKEDIKKSIEENEENEKNKEIFEENNEEKNNVNANSRYGPCVTESNKIKYTTGMEFNNSLFNIKKTPKKYKAELGQNDNLVDSVKKIFLYNNNKNSKNKNLYNNIKLADFMQNSFEKGTKV